MARAGMSDEEMTAFIKETFCVDSTYEAADLFAAAELPPSWPRRGVHEARPQHISSKWYKGMVSAWRTYGRVRACRPTYLLILSYLILSSIPIR